MKKYFFKSLLFFAAIVLFSCNQNKKIQNNADSTSGKSMAENNIAFSGDTSTKDMVRIPEGTFMMGGDNSQADKDEYPKHKVIVDAFFMDEHEVTNAQFQKFVDATNYLTTAEQKPDWEQLKKQLPPNTPKPDDSQLVAASLVFTPPNHPVDLNNYSQWWSWVPGANWKHPSGPKSDIKGKENFPVVQVSWDDANAYCKWAGKRLPQGEE
jgi:sulfatase modifying factor 1